MLQTMARQTETLGRWLDWFDRQVALGHFSREYRLECHRIVRTFWARYPEVPLDRLTPEHIERYLTDGRMLSRRTMATDLMRLRSFFRWAQEAGLVPDNPTMRVKRPRYTATPRAVVTATEFPKVCRACRTLEEICIVEVLYHTGLRVSELCHLRRDTLDLEQRWAIVEGKGRRTAYVFFPRHVADLLRAHLDSARPNPWVFYAPKRWKGADHPRRPDWLNGVLHRLGRDAGLKYTLTAHLLRHGLAWMLKTSEMPLAAVQQVMRHQNIQTTIDLYGRLQPEDVHALYDKYVPGGTGRD
jgi:integrase